MPSYEVKLPANTPGLTLKEGHDVMYVEAATGADAIAMAAGHYDGDAEGAWSGVAVATEVTVPADLSPVTVLGKTTAFKCWVTVTGGNADAGPAYFEYESIAADTYDGSWTALAAVIALDADFPNAAWAADLLTISSIGDDYGDHTVTAGMSYGGVDVPSLTGAITHEGIAGAVLTVATNAAPTLPKVHASARS